MPLFSMSDPEEIRQRRIELDKRAAELERLAADLQHRQELNQQQQEHLEKQRQEFTQQHAQDLAAIENQRREFAEWRRQAEEQLAAQQKDVTDREAAIALREVQAKAGYVSQQRAAFEEAIGTRTSQLDRRQEDLNALESQLTQLLGDIALKEGELASRELAVKKQELQVRAGLPQESGQLVQMIEAREAACREEEERLRAREQELQARYAALETKSEDLRKRESQLSLAESERDAGFADARRRVDIELHDRRRATESELARIVAERLEKLDAELTAERERRIEIVADELRQERQRVVAELQKERQRVTNELQQERQRIAAELDDQRALAEQERSARRNALQAEERIAAESRLAAQQELSSQRGQLAGQEQELRYREALLEAREDGLNLRREQLDAEVKSHVQERKAAFDASERELQLECARLRESLTRTQSLLGHFEQLQAQLGSSPENVLATLNEKEEELVRLREELAQRPTTEAGQQIKTLASERQRLQDRVKELIEENSEIRRRQRDEGQLQFKLSDAENEILRLTSRNQSLDLRCNQLDADLKRLQAAYKREDDRAARIRDIEIPYFETVPAFREKAAEIDEVQWLEGIAESCIDYGLRFHPRILYAFHTALKTAEWSPMAVLAGVSGTGKSELPKLYAHFGGMQFLPLAVQPNWDSQEAMLGFFNSIDNKFDAQPVLRLLAQSQKKNGQEYPGLLDALCLVLLDEMNLAHAELYFAEFLSKLELRRGMKGGDVPFLDVKLGAGLPPYALPLGRNVLWTGTMNQDETTKALSDKVLDRSIVIHFPRPTSLERREELKPLPPAAPLLPRKVWEQWWSRSTGFSEQQVQPFKAFIEEMNTALAQVGRALGHRVWQSVEYYMANYPEVRAARKAGDDKQTERAMRTAFEDQLVQKVMPKLRGIETRGKSKSECLDRIRAQLVREDYKIVEDFDLACEFGYGQFIWQSANYLREEMSAAPAADTVAAALEGPLTSTAVEASAVTQNTPSGRGAGVDLAVLPPHFMPDNPERDAKWHALTDKQKRLYANRVEPAAKKAKR